MKRILLVLLFIILISSVIGYDSAFLPLGNIALAPTAQKVVSYCVWKSTYHLEPVIGLPVEINYLCRDVDGNYGCQPADPDPGSELTLSLSGFETDADGCVEVTLESNNADGLYYFSLNGDVAGTSVTLETGKAYIVPEFSSIGAGLLLIGAGLVIQKRRIQKR